MLAAHVVLCEGSIRRAARTLGRPASTVGDAIARIESQLAITLVDRQNGGMSQTLLAEPIGRSLSGIAATLSRLAQLILAKRAESAQPVETLQAWLADNSISLSALERYTEVIRTGSIRRAARNLGLRQPQLSRQIARLEELFGVALLERSSDGCVPTDIGRAVYGEAAVLHTQWQALTSPANDRFSRQLKTVHFGAVMPLRAESRTAGLLASVVSGWRPETLGHHLSLSTTTAQELIDGLNVHRFDVALVDSEVTSLKLESRVLFTSELGLVGPLGFSRTHPTRADWSRCRFAVPSVRSGLRQGIADILGATSSEPDRLPANAVEIDSLPVIVRMISEHGYLSILPLDAVANLQGLLEVRRLPNAPSVPFHLVWQPTTVARRAAAEIERIMPQVKTTSPEMLSLA